MFSCKQATELTIKKNQHTLCLGDWFRLQMHLFICKYCRRFFAQNKIIDKALHEIEHHHHHYDVPSDFKERVLHELEK